MKTSLRLSFFGAAAVALGSFAFAGDEPPGMLSNAPGFVPAVTFSEQYRERVVTTREEGEVFREEVGRTVAVAHLTASMVPVDLSTISGDTDVSVSFGGLQHSSILSEAAGWRPGRRRAVFPLFSEDDGVTAPRRIGAVTYSWTARRLNVLIIGAGIGSVIAEEFSENEAGPLERQEVEASVSFGGGSGARPVFTSGRVSVRTVGFGSGEFRETFDLTTIVARGAADRTRPLLTITAPRQNARTTTPDVELTGMLGDRSGSADIVSITVNGVDSGAGADITPNDDPRRPATWVSTIFPDAGRNEIVVTAVDSSGNTTVKRRVFFSNASGAAAGRSFQQTVASE